MFQDLLDVADSLNKGVSSVSESEISSSPSLATVHEGLKLCESQLLQVVSCIYVHALLKFINILIRYFLNMAWSRRIRWEKNLIQTNMMHFSRYNLSNVIIGSVVSTSVT